MQVAYNILVDIKKTVYDKYLYLNVLVVPHNILKQWLIYINTMSDDFNTYVVNTSKAFDMLLSKIDTINLLVVTSTFYKKVALLFIEKNMHVNRVAFDEVDSANTPNARGIPCNFNWFITASYKNVINPYSRWYYHDDSTYYLTASGITNNGFVKNIFANITRNSHNVDNAVIDGIIVKNEDAYIDMSFSLPEVIRSHIICRNSIEIDILKDVINQNILHCLNAGDVKGAISYLNQSNVDTEDNIIYHVKKDLDIKLSNLKANLDYAYNLIYLNDAVKEKNIARIIKDKEEVEIKIKLVTERIKENNTCIICYNEINNKCITNCCKNSFCFKCITTWCVQKSSCPLCKTNINLKENIFIVNENNELDDNVHAGYVDLKYSKYENLKILLGKSKKENRKILIFSEYDNSFKNIKEVIKSHNIAYAQLKGNAINNIVSKYKDTSENGIDILLVNSRAYGSGLNLENTTDVILFHRFDLEIEKQIIGRAQRPGRKNPLNVWYLLHEDE